MMQGAGCQIFGAIGTCGQSFIDNGSFNYIHFVNDFSLASDSPSGCQACAATGLPSIPYRPKNLIIERRHRYRDSSWISSFGPGVYCNYDVKIHLYTSGTGSAIDLFDPQDTIPYTLVDGTQGDTLDGIFHDVASDSVRDIRLFDSTGTLTTNIGSAITAQLNNFDGTQFVFGVVAATSDGTVEEPTGYWKLDETSGTIAVDSSVNGFNGTLSGCTVNKPGKRATSYLLNGTSDYINLGSPAGLSLSGAISVAAWIKPQSSATSQSVVSRNDGTNALNLGISGGQYVWGNGSATATYAIPSGDIGSWVHLAGTFDGASWTIYRNGKQVAQQAVGTSAQLGAGNWALGADGTGSTGFFSGNLDDVYIFNRMLVNFEIQLLQTPGDLSGRLTNITDRNGYGTTITYQSFSPADLAASPDRNWQINTVTDAYGRVATFSYNPVQVSGRWVVSQIALPNGQNVQYTYTGDQLSQVTRPDSTVSTFTYGVDSATQTSTIQFDDVAADGSHRQKTAYLTNNAVTDSTSTLVYNQSSLAIRFLTDNAGDVRYMNVSIPDSTQNAAYVYEGAGKMKQILTSSGAGYLKDGWTIGDPTLGPGAVTGTLESTYVSAPYTNHAITFPGIYPTVTDENGITCSYLYDADNFKTQKTYPDSTTEMWAYNSFKQVARYQDRLGRVTLYTYDALGNMTKKEEGILVVGGVDTPQPEYAATRWQYYGAGDPNQYLLSAMIDPNGNETDYAYNTNHYLTSVTQPPDTTGGARGVTSYTYDTTGRLSTVTDPVGRVVQYNYDYCNRIVKVIYADSSTERTIYGAAGSGLENLVVKYKDRNGNVTSFNYDTAGRVSQKTVAGSTMDLLDNETPITDPSIPQVTTYTYLTGTDLPLTVTTAGETTTYTYDYRQRVISTTVQPQVGHTLISTSTYTNNLLAQTTDPYGRNKYKVYRSSDAALIRMVQGTVPADGVGTSTVAATISRDLTPNAKFAVMDLVLDAEQQTLQTIDPLGTITTNTYDAQGRVIRSIVADTTAIAAKTETDFDAVGNAVQVRLPRHFDSSDPVVGACYNTYTYTGRNLLAAQTLAAGTAIAATTQYTYNVDGTQATRIDPRSNTWTTLWSPCCAGRVSAKIDPTSASMSLEYDTYGNVTHTQTLSGVNVINETTTCYDARNRPTYQTVWLTTPPAVNPQNPPIAGLGGVATTSGLTTSFVYDENLTDGVGLDSTFSAQLTGLAFGAGSTGSAKLVTNPAGERTLLVMDGTGRGVKAVQLAASGTALVSTATTYDVTISLSGYGTVVQTTFTDALGHTNQQQVDAAGRTIQTLDATNQITKYTYDANSNQLSVRDPNSVGLTCVYDARNRDTSCTDTFGATTGKTYDKSNNVTVTIDAKSQNTTFSYDARDRRSSSTDRNSGVTQWTFDRNSNLLTLQDAEGQTTTYSYDVRNLQVTETLPDGGTRTYTYDGAMRLTVATDQQGDFITLVYDEASRLTARQYRDHTKAPTDPPNDTDVFTFDAASRVLSAASGRYTNTLSFAYDAASRRTSESLAVAGQTYTTTLSYDAASNLTGMTYPDGTAVVRTYTARDQLLAVTYNGVMVANNITYDVGSRETQRTLGNTGTTNFSYRTDNLLSGVTNVGIPSFTYTYDANKNRTAETANNHIANYSWTTGGTGYDNEDRLTTWSRTGTSDSQSWTLSLVGDWSSTTINGTAQPRTHTLSHELVAINGVPLTYDLKGNLTQRNDGRTFAWDFDNRLRTTTLSGASASYTYDALGRRVSKSVSGVTTVYMSVTKPIQYSPWAGQEIVEYTSGAAPASPTQAYVYGRSIDEPLVLVSGSNRYYYNRNALGSITTLANSVGNANEHYVYNAYGAVTILAPNGTSVRTTSSFNNPFTYTGRRLDPETGLYYYRARYYDSSQGRFLSRDSIGYVKRLSLYDYGAGRPYFYIDPSGHDEIGSTEYGTFGGGGATKSGAAGKDGRANWKYDMLISFQSDKQKCICKQIEFLQSVREVDNETGKPVTQPSDPNDRALYSRATTNGTSIDRTNGNSSPYWGRTATSNAGRRSSADLPKGSLERMRDTPESDVKHAKWEFTTCAVCAAGQDEGKKYGCVSWGYSYDKEGNLTPLPTTMTTDTAELDQAAKNWNAQARGPAQDRNHPNQEQIKGYP
jgi:RHS repeat-associated protein